MRSKKILVVNDRRGGYDRPFRNLGMEIVHEVKYLNADPCGIGLVIFTGGADVSPELYEGTPHPKTNSNVDRDIAEVSVFDRAQELELPMIGICRGAQFLCVMSGGRLIQDVTNHLNGSHFLRARYPNSVRRIKFDTRGDHHQMQYPWDLPGYEYSVLAEAVSPLSTHYAFGPWKSVDTHQATAQTKREPDVVWYSRTRALAIQFHPEWMPPESAAVIYIRKLVDHYIVPIIDKKVSKLVRG